MERVREGGCGCGHLRYRVTGEPIMVHNCHCRLCQRQTGSTSVVNAFFEGDRVTVLQGSLSEHEVKTGTGRPHVICRCTACGTAVWSWYARLGRLSYGIRAGTLDDPDSVTPDVVIFLESKMPWVAVPAGIPQFDQYYEFADVLPADRIERLMKLVERRAAGEG
ncbi:aldehyde-activating protein [Altererythrobacter sp. B11]|uniref:GFA family protein n=1 Tax=Altererythrobacter sp. B11 TaxID=2060312 RepID=UPI000DC6F1BA|nr:GFA family protein [Altererythrobacter sp. B11]BBC74222.1 aldehyde-activating protein [Altererythrobacter sp. B11]